jgi:MFS family permease
VISGLGFLASVDEFVYLPAISAMVDDFKTTQTLGVLTISVYLFAVSLSGLIWGVLSDCYGCKALTSYVIGCFVLSVIGSYFSPNIYVFLVCRALQGCLVSITLVIGQGTIADLYAANERGSATGIFYGTYFSGGFLGSVLGGQVSQHFGWRSSFLFVGIISFFMHVSYILLVPETQHWKVVSKYEKLGIKLLQSDDACQPTLTNPCLPLQSLVDSTVLPYVFLLAIGFMSINVGILLFSTKLSKAPYYYHEDSIGILYLPMTISMFIGSIVGGKLSDHVAIHYFQTSKIIEGRIVPALLFSFLTSIGLVIYGWSSQYNAHVSIIILAQVMYCLSQAATRPGIYAYYTIKYQQHSAGITSANNFVQLLLTSIVLTFTTKIAQSIQDGPYYTVLALCNLLATGLAIGIIYRKVRLSKDSEKQLLYKA